MTRMTLIIDSSYWSRRVLPTTSFATPKRLQKIHFHDPKCYLKVLLKLWSKQKLANRAFVERTVVTAMARITSDFLEHVIGDDQSKMTDLRWHLAVETLEQADAWKTCFC